MTSKEALEELLYYANLNFERENERKTEFANKIEQIGISDNEENFKIIKKDLDRLEILEKENKELKEENKILKEGIKSLLNYCDDLYLYEEKPYHITEEGIIHTFFDYEKEDLEKIKLMFEVLENE